MRKDNTRSLVEHAIATATPSNGGWWRASCPICMSTHGKEDKKKALGFYPQTGFYHCFRCETRGHLHGNFDAYAYTDTTPDTIEHIQPPDGFMLLSEEPAVSANATKLAREYLIKRRVPETIWVDAGIGVTLTGDQRKRIVVPIFSTENVEWNGWVARSWLHNPYLPYIYPTGMQRGDIFWNEAALLEQTDEPVFVMEGVFDALPYYPNAIACLGKPTRNQFPLLLEATRPIVVVLDGDAWELGKALSMRLALKGKNSSYIRLPPKKDPNEVDVRNYLTERIS